MREVKLSNGKVQEVRPLTRGEIRSLKEFGIGLASFDVPRDRYDETTDAVLATQIDNIEDLAAPDSRKLFQEIFAETYGSPDEEKNSSPSGPSDQTATI